MNHAIQCWYLVLIWNKPSVGVISKFRYLLPLKENKDRIIQILLNNRALQVDLATPSEHRSQLTIIR